MTVTLIAPPETIREFHLDVVSFNKAVSDCVRRIAEAGELRRHYQQLASECDRHPELMAQPVFLSDGGETCTGYQLRDEAREAWLSALEGMRDD